MSAHDTHNPDIENSGELKSKTSFKASFWFVIILVGLFIAALNFIKVIGNDHEEGHGGPGAEHATEHSAPGHEGHAPGDTTPDLHGNNAVGAENENHTSGSEVEEAHTNADTAAAGTHH
jgi:hypothetical protein